MSDLSAERIAEIRANAEDWADRVRKYASSAQLTKTWLASPDDLIALCALAADGLRLRAASVGTLEVSTPMDARSIHLRTVDMEVLQLRGKRVRIVAEGEIPEQIP